MQANIVADIILTHFDHTGDLVTNKKLQKLLYYVEAWSLVYHSSLIDEEFEAWVHGPVIPEVYQNYKHFGYSPIRNTYQEGESASSKMRQLLGTAGLQQDQLDLMFAVLEKYGSLTSYQLEHLSHSEQPWLEARKGLGPLDYSSTPISKELMKNYYSSLVNVKEA